MDLKVYNENNFNMNLCFNAELKPRTVKDSEANTQELKDSQLLHKAHEALVYTSK